MAAMTTDTAEARDNGSVSEMGGHAESTAAAVQRAWDNPMPRDLQEAVEDEVAAHASDRHRKYGDVLNGINIVYPLIRDYLREHPEALGGKP